MDTSAEPYEIVLRSKRNLKRAEQSISKSTSPSAVDTISTNAQPPETSLLGLPKELFNYIVELAVVKEPDEGPVEANVEFKQLIGGRQGGRHVFRESTPSVALGRTCTVLAAIALPMHYLRNTFAFRSANHASRWLSLKHQRSGMTLVRRVRIRFKVKVTEGSVSQRRNGQHFEIELFLAEETDMLALAANCSFCVQACQSCRSILVRKIEDVNGRTRQFKTGLERMLALLEHSSNKRGVLMLVGGRWVCFCI